MNGSPNPDVDVIAVLTDFQTQLNALNQAVVAQQATIDALVDEVIGLIKDRDRAGQ